MLKSGKSIHQNIDDDLSKLNKMISRFLWWFQIFINMGVIDSGRVDGLHKKKHNEKLNAQSRFIPGLETGWEDELFFQKGKIIFF